MFTSYTKAVPVVATLGLIIQLSAPAFAQNYQSPNYGSNQSYQPNNTGNYNSAQPPSYQQQPPRIAYVPAGMTMRVSLATSISTDVAKPGDMIEAQLTQPIQLGDSTIPTGSTVIGEVASAKSGGFLGRAGMLTVRFDRLRTPNGTEVPMAAHIVGGLGKYQQTADGSNTFAGETWKNKVGQGVLRGAIGAGTGAALGTAIGAIAGRGHGFTRQALGRGAWSGAAIGGGLGVADSVLLRKGKNVIIASGTPMQLQLDAPMSVQPGQQMGAF